MVLLSKFFHALYFYSLKQVDTYHSYYSITFPGQAVQRVSYGIVKRLDAFYPPQFEKRPRSIHNSKKLGRTILRSLGFIRQFTPRHKSISQLVGPKRHCLKYPDSQMIYSRVAFKPHFESLCCITISRLFQSWRLDMIEPFHKEQHPTWKLCITVCRKDSRSDYGRRCRLY